MTRKEKIILLGKFNDVLYKLGLSDKQNIHLNREDITIWQIYTIEKSLNILKRK